MRVIIARQQRHRLLADLARGVGEHGLALPKGLVEGELVGAATILLCGKEDITGLDEII